MCAGQSVTRAAIRVYIKPATPHIACIHIEMLGLAALHNIAEYFFYTLLMKVLVLAIGNQIFEQAFAVYCTTLIAYIHRCPIRLVGDWTVGSQQMLIECLVGPAAVIHAQITCVRAVAVNRHSLLIYAVPLWFSNGFKTVVFSQLIKNNIDVCARYRG